MDPLALLIWILAGIGTACVVVGLGVTFIALAAIKMARRPVTRYSVWEEIRHGE